MSTRNWVQPQLDGGAIRAVKIEVRFVWPSGWNGTCSIKQEGWVAAWIEVSRLSEADSSELSQWMRLVSEFVAYSD